MQKAYLFDIDGVLVHHENWFFEYFSKSYSPDALSVLKQYCDGADIIKCDRGLADSFQLIEPYLRKIGYSGSIENFFNLKNSFESEGIDRDALNKIRELKRRGNKCFIGSNQDKRRKSYLKKVLHLDEIVNESYFSCDFGFVKPENEYWEIVHKKIDKHINQISAQNIVFFDDREDNIESARKYGFTGIKIENRTRIHKELDILLS